MARWNAMISRRQTRPAVTPADEVVLTVISGRAYGSGYADSDVEQAGREDGDARIHDKAVWGANAENRTFPRVLVHGHGVNSGLVGHDYATQAGDLAAQREELAEDAASAEEKALDSIDHYATAGREQADVEAEIREEGLRVPDVSRRWMYPACLAGFVLGDLTLVAVAYQVLGLSERLMFGFLPFTSPLDIAASTGVFAVLVLAHFAAAQLRRALHPARGAGEALGGGARASAVLAGVFFLAAVGVVFGWAEVRSAYLAETGKHSEYWAFLAIQSGMLVGASALAFNHAHPYRNLFCAAHVRAIAAAKAMLGCCEEHARLVAQVNAIEHRMKTLVNQAAHHLQISASDVNRQIALYVRAVILNQPEPVQTALVEKNVPAAEAPKAKDAAKFLDGAIERPHFERVSTEKVKARRQQVREELREVAARAGIPDTQPEGIREALDGLEPAAEEAAATNGGSAR